MEATIKRLATKDDLVNIKEDIANLRKEWESGISDFRREWGSGILNLRKEMAENRAENIKWMFIFWIANVGTMLAIALFILKNK